MKKSMRLLALLLAAMLIVSMLAACGSTSSSDETEATEESTETAETEETEETEEAEEAEEAEEVETEEAEAEEESAEEESTEEAESEEAASGSSVSYPIEGDVTLTIWRPFETMMWGDLMESYDDMPLLETFKEATGVQLEFTSVSSDNSTELFNLMIASGDWNDLINLSTYTGGLSKAYEDELCYDLTPLLEEYMPDYYAVLEDLHENNLNAWRQTVTDDGLSLAVYSINDSYVQEQGLVYRADWAEEIGLSDIVTIADLETYLEYVVAEYSPAYALTPSTGGTIDGITGAFGTTGFDASGDSVDLGLYLEGDTVVSSVTSENYRAYIEWFLEMYQMGAIKNDFYSESYGPDWINSYFSDDDVAISFLRSDKITTIIGDATDEDFDLLPTSSIVQNEGDIFTFGDEQTIVSVNFSVMSTTEHLEECLMFLNWFYTDEGYIASNYGVEGWTFNYADDGSVEYTELITDSGYSNAIQVKNMYGGMIFPFLKDIDAFFYTYADIEQEAMDIWSEISDDSILPTFELSSEASTTYAYIASDICTYAASQAMKWLTGTDALTDESWDAYVAECESLGLSEAVALYQDAYDSFVNRE